jgi:hypothetical protein
MSSSTFLYRYETGSQGHDGTLDNCCEYFAKKLDAMRFAQGLFQKREFKSTYVYDRCLNFTRWFDGQKWSRKQPIA